MFYMHMYAYIYIYMLTNQAGEMVERQLPTRARTEDGHPWNSGDGGHTETKADGPAT